MQYNFDEVIDRSNTKSFKYDYSKEMGVPEKAIPLWVADMDFQIPREATEAIMKSAQHAIYGYTITNDEYKRAVMDWFAKRFDFESKAEWIVTTPGVVFALAVIVRAFTQERDSVMIQKPVYHPFERIVVANKRKLVENSLVYENGAYHIDFDDFEQKIIENDVRMFILCSPHNPVGRVWTKDELRRMGEICLRHNCLVISDEIHCDIIYEGYKHNVFSTIDASFLDNTIICTAPSKTFNLAGLQNSNIFIANERLRGGFIKEYSKTGYEQLNTMGVVASQAVYEHGHIWLAELLQYLQGNLNFMKEFFKKHTKVKIVEPEGTYLVWLDFKDFGLSQDELDDLLLNKAQIWLSSGTSFGGQGEGFQRINIACPRKTLQCALERLEKVI